MKRLWLGIILVFAALCICPEDQKLVKKIDQPEYMSFLNWFGSEEQTVVMGTWNIPDIFSYFQEPEPSITEDFILWIRYQLGLYKPKSCIEKAQDYLISSMSEMKCHSCIYVNSLKSNVHSLVAEWYSAGYNFVSPVVKQLIRKTHEMYYEIQIGGLDHYITSIYGYIMRYFSDINMKSSHDGPLEWGGNWNNNEMIKAQTRIRVKKVQYFKQVETKFLCPAIKQMYYTPNDVVDMQGQICGKEMKLTAKELAEKHFFNWTSTVNGHFKAAIENVVDLIGKAEKECADFMAKILKPRKFQHVTPNELHSICQSRTTKHSTRYHVKMCKEKVAMELQGLTPDKNFCLWTMKMNNYFRAAIEWTIKVARNLKSLVIKCWDIIMVMINSMTYEIMRAVTYDWFGVRQWTSRECLRVFLRLTFLCVLVVLYYTVFLPWYAVYHFQTSIWPRRSINYLLRDRAEKQEQRAEMDRKYYVDKQARLSDLDLMKLVYRVHKEKMEENIGQLEDVVNAQKQDIFQLEKELYYCRKYIVMQSWQYPHIKGNL